MKDQKPKLSEPRNILRVESVSKAFGGLQALYDISFTVQKGLVYGLIGPNGAGKTTLFNLITGVLVPDEGEIFFDDHEIRDKEIHDIVNFGISRTFQNIELFGSMTVLENIMVGHHVRSKSGFLGAFTRLPWVIKEEKNIREKAFELLQFIGLEKYANYKSIDLPFGWQRLLEIARALASQPKMLLLDEPAAGLNAVETQGLGELMKQIKAKGITMMLVEHDMSLTMNITDRIFVLNQGRKLAEGTPKEIQSDEAVMEAYLGKAK